MTTLHQKVVTVLEARGWAEAAGLYAILDACDTPAVLDKVKALGPGRALSLYKGRAEEELEAIAPYLVSVDSDLFDWIKKTLWCEPWGIFARCEGDIESLRKHFRKFLLVESPDGEEWYFRYYDPRILPEYLPTCTEGELVDFFGQVTMLAIVDPESRVIKGFDLVEPAFRVTFRRPSR